MTQFSDLAKENNIDLDDSIIFIRDNDDVLAVNIKYIGIKQRQDTTMGVNFSITPKEAMELVKYFDKFATGEKFYYNISQTGYRPVYYRGLSPIRKEANHEDSSRFNITLMMQPAIVEPEDNYFEPSCDCCDFCHIE